MRILFMRKKLNDEYICICINNNELYIDYYEKSSTHMYSTKIQCNTNCNNNTININTYCDIVIAIAGELEKMCSSFVRKNKELVYYSLDDRINAYADETQKILYVSKILNIFKNGETI